MAVKLLQSLVQRVASQTGVRATGLECKAFYSATGTFAATLSLPRHPRADVSTDPDADPSADGAMERAVRRAGRSVRLAGGLAHPAIAKAAPGAIPSTGAPTWRPAAHVSRGGCGWPRTPSSTWSKPGCNPQIWANRQAA